MTGLFQVAAEQYAIDAVLLESIGAVESGLDPNKVSKAGARGLMQLTDIALLDIGEDPETFAVFDAEANILAGAAYLVKIRDYYLARFGLEGASLTFWMIVAYNWGPHNVMQHLTHGKGALSVPNEVFVYVCRVLREYCERYRTLRLYEQGRGSGWFLL